MFIAVEASMGWIVEDGDIIDIAFFECYDFCELSNNT